MPDLPLKTDEIPFALFTEVPDPATPTNLGLAGALVPGLGLHRFFRFRQPVALTRVELPAPTHYGGIRGGALRRVQVFGYPGDLSTARLLFSGEVPEVAYGETLTLPLPDVTVLAASVRVDERYPLIVPIADAGGVNHPTTYTLPFTSLDGLRWYGTAAGPRALDIPFQPPLVRGAIAPRALPGQTLTQDAHEVRFTSAFLDVGFSIKRPQLTVLGWDAYGGGNLTNFLYRIVQLTRCLTGGNGPSLYDLNYDASPLSWTGQVEVEGNVVRYRDLHVRPGLTVQAEFTVTERGLMLRLAQQVAQALTVLDAGAWGFLWNGRASAVATNALPLRGNRRNGGIEARGAWAAPGFGTLNFHAAPGGDPVELQVDGTGFHGRTAMANIQLGTQHTPDGAVTLLAGTHRAELHFDVRAAVPSLRPGAGPLHEGLGRSWGSTFAFRPEGGGFSNNGYSINCQNCLYFQADLAPYTATPADGPDLMELVRYTAHLAVHGGPGYGAYWEQAMDAAPSLAISLARVHQTRPNADWLTRNWNYLRRPFDYLLAHLDATGLYVHPHYSGNTGETGANCNMWDTIGFGHYDAYAGAMAYRALRGGVGLARDAGDADLSERCRLAADQMQAAYLPTLRNPATGLIAGWRSADGEFHDHSYTYVNGIAICYGLVPEADARAILTTLEAERAALGHDDFRFGICLNLKPIPRNDYLIGHWGGPQRDAGDDTFGVYINGSLTPAGAYFYLRALSIHGFTAAADKICDHLLDSFARRRFEGGPNSGLEYYTLDGMPCGYEGSLTHVPHILLAIAQHRGDLETLTPEWWPA